MKKRLLLCLAFLFAAGLLLPVLPEQTTYAAPIDCATRNCQSSTPSPTPSGSSNLLVDSAKCVDSDTAKCPINCPDPASGVPVTDPACPAARNCQALNSGCNVVAKYLNPLITVVTILAGLAIVTGIIIGGIQYASSGGDPQKAATGKKHIKMSVVALIGLLFMYAFLNFLIPGGSTVLVR